MRGKAILLLLFAATSFGNTNLVTLTESSLEAALQSGGKIHFQSGGIIKLSKQLFVNRDVDLDAQSKQVIIDGQGGVPLFFITNANFNARGITFQNGFEYEFNGYATNYSTNPPPYGGALRIFRSSVQLNDCSFLNNRALGRTFSMPAMGGAIYLEHSTLFVSNCVFRGNTVQGGPAPRITVHLPTHWYSYNSFTGNGSGGAIAGGENALGQISKSTFDSNGIRGLADRWGGGGSVFIAGTRTWSFQSAHFLNNFIEGIYDYERAYSRGDGGRGGAIDVQSSAVFTDCFFSNNVIHAALSRGGGGIAHGGAVAGRAVFNRSSFVRNLAIGGGNAGEGQGGAFYGVGSFTNCTFAYNHASSANGAYLLTGSDEPSPFPYTLAPDAKGGAISGPAHVAFCTIVSNTLSVGTNIYSHITPNRLGGGIYHSLQTYPPYDRPVLLHSSILAGNTCSNIIGAVSDFGGNIFSDQPANASTNSRVNADPLLGSLRSDPAGTVYFPLHSGSPAIDFIEVTENREDQLGLTRPSGTLADSGSIEYRGSELRVIISPASAGSQRFQLYQSAETSGLLEMSYDLKSWFQNSNSFLLHTESATENRAFFRGRATHP